MPESQAIVWVPWLTDIRAYEYAVFPGTLENCDDMLVPSRVAELLPAVGVMMFMYCVNVCPGANVPNVTSCILCSIGLIHTLEGSPLEPPHEPPTM